MSYELSHRKNNEMAEVLARLAVLERQVRQLPARPAHLHPAALEIQIEQAAHGFAIGKAVTIASGAWTLFTDPGSSAYTPARPLWGIITAVPDPDRFRLAISGEGVTTSSTLVPGFYYTFINGDPAQIQGGYPPMEGSGVGFSVMAYSNTSVCIANDSRFQGLQSMDGTYAVVHHEDIGAGHYVVWAGVPSGQSPLALADPANPWKWTNVGIALFEVGGSGSWLVLTMGEHTWYDYDNGDTRPAWMTTPAYNAGQRIYLSDTNPGQYATAEPAFKVYAGISAASYTPADPPNPECTTFAGYAVGQGVPYPIPASGGGTGTDVSALDEHSVLFMDDYGSPAARKIAGLLSATADYAVIAQKNSEAPVHLALDLDAAGSFVVELGTLYASAGGIKFAATVPTDEQLMWFDGTAWSPVTLIANVGGLVSKDAAGLVEVDASTPYSVLGVAGASASVPVPIAAGAVGKIFQRGAGGLEFSDDPTLKRGATDFKLCTVNTITTDTAAPTASGVKGQMHFIY